MTMLEAGPFPGEEIEPNPMLNSDIEQTLLDELDEFLLQTGNPEVRQHLPGPLATREYVFTEYVCTD